MVAIEIFEKFSKFQTINYAGVEDFADRLHFQLTVVLLFSACTTVSFKTYFLSPVACYLPNEIGSKVGQEQYVNNYCWAEGTYSVPLGEFHVDNTQSDPLEKYKKNKIIYYQWVPFLLGLQSFMFYLPRVIWQFLSRIGAGTDIHHLIKSAEDAVKADGDKQQTLVTHITRRIQMLLNKNSKVALRNSSWKRKVESLWKCFRLLPSRHLGNFLILGYVLVKLLYIANGVGQLFFMYYTLGFNRTQGYAFGGKILGDLLRGKNWQSTGLFPRVGSCAIEFKVGSSSNYIFSQCTLPINMINEKIYVFLWFWTLIVTGVTCLTIPKWVFRALTTSWRMEYVESQLRACDRYGGVDRRDRNRFMREFLRLDGIFLLRMIAHNAGDVICAQIIGRLWDEYISEKHGTHEKGSYFKLQVPEKRGGEGTEKPDDAEQLIPGEPMDSDTQQLRHRKTPAATAAATAEFDNSSNELAVRPYPEEKEIKAMDTDV